MDADDTYTYIHIYGADYDKHDGDDDYDDADDDDDGDDGDDGDDCDDDDDDDDDDEDEDDDDDEDENDEDDYDDYDDDDDDDDDEYYYDYTMCITVAISKMLNSLPFFGLPNSASVVRVYSLYSVINRCYFQKAQSLALLWLAKLSKCRASILLVFCNHIRLYLLTLLDKRTELRDGFLSLECLKFEVALLPSFKELPVVRFLLLCFNKEDFPHVRCVKLLLLEARLNHRDLRDFAVDLVMRNLEGLVGLLRRFQLVTFGRFCSTTIALVVSIAGAPGCFLPFCSRFLNYSGRLAVTWIGCTIHMFTYHSVVLWLQVT